MKCSGGQGTNCRKTAWSDDIKNVFKGIVKEDAERIKKEYGTCVPDTSKDVILAVNGIKGRPAVEIRQSELAEVIVARLDEIMARIMEEVQASGYADKLGCGMVLTGGGSLLKQIKPYAEYRTGMTVRIGLPEEGIVFNEDTEPVYGGTVRHAWKNLHDRPDHPVAAR